ncbi:mitochondrial membrane protein Pet127 [Colletotrichum higginsianum]|uniref:Mitochondrial membrane protein Pet127 n=2 Tax=Colletotrichum higginsianum TaxID=80884 RepID=H1VQS1_COLHI|nr:mitochondrial membrane protein Pet127 [Colletotrichum higginsianum]CCF42577.1 mitochondrial membrane protein Pet127 [Colletotrichum higginsianum]
MPINEFDFNALKKYVTSSKDNTLVGLAAKLRKKYTGSTSSMTQMLSHFHYLLSAWRPINASNLSRQFNPDFTSFTQILRAPAAAFLHLKDDVYAIDADKEYDSASILSMLGKSMEKLLTLPKDEFERYRRANSGQITEEERNAEEAFHYTTMGDFLMRSQLDAYDPRLPGSGMFDLKTRAVVSIRMDSQGFQKGLGYEIRKRFGQWESFEREYFDMIRAAFLKYSLQVRMGRMDGIFVAFHNTQRIFGFQYVSLEEMDLSLHGTENRTLGDQEFKLSLHLLNKVLDRATERFPGRSIRLHVETRPTDPPFMYVFAKPVTSEEIEKVQTSNQTAVAEYEKQILGLAQEESEPEAPEPEAEQLVSQEEETVSIDEARNQLRQTQAFWEEMQEKVDEAVEDDALGIGHVREAIQDALEQSGLLKARTPEEARWYVDGLLEALTPKQANDVRENNGKENEQVESLVSGTVASTTASAQGDGLGAAQADTPTSSEATSVAQETGEAQPPQGVENTSIPSTDRVDSGVRGSRDLGLKDLILQVATRVDEKAEVEEFDDDAASDVSKLRTFERILSELVARSRQAESGPTSSTTSPVDGLSSETSSDGLETSIRSAAAVAATAESIKEAASDAGEKSREADTELYIKKGELLGMVVTIRNKVNGQYVPRPDPLSSRSSWVLEYSIEDLPGDRAKTIYKALQDRRKKVLVHDDPKDREKQWYSMFSGKLEAFSSKGKQYRKEQDALSKTSPIHVLGEEEPLTWDEAFGHQKEWKTLSPDETNDS